MAENSKIEWTTHTFNPWRGCTKVSEGCTNCYADTMSKRNPKSLGIWGPNGTRVVASETMWREPMKWNNQADAAGERHRVFCASLADVFENWKGNVVASNGNPFWWCYGSLSNSPIPSIGLGNGCRMATLADIRKRLFQLIDDTPKLDWLLLTKRPENIAKMMPSHVTQYIPEAGEMSYREGVRPNVWLGTSVENQATADERIPHLLRVPAAVRFLSMEPLLGPISLGQIPRVVSSLSYDPEDDWTFYDNCLTGMKMHKQGGWSDDKFKLQWVIIGGESGHGARPMQIEWARDLVRQCKAARVACFVKQLGAKPEMTVTRRRATAAMSALSDLVSLGLIDRKGGDWSEWPEDLRIRQLPEAAPCQ